MRRFIAIAVLCVGAAQGSLAADPGADRLVHRFLAVEISPNGGAVASIEGDSSKSGGAPTVRDLVIRQVRTAGSGVTGVGEGESCNRNGEEQGVGKLHE